MLNQNISEYCKENIHQNQNNLLPTRINITQAINCLLIEISMASFYKQCNAYDGVNTKALNNRPSINRIPVSHYADE